MDTIVGLLKHWSKGEPLQTPQNLMEIKQVELKDINVKALQSLDKSIKLIIYINANENNKVDINKLYEFLHEPLKLEIEKDG